jgi:hypothetical protein
MSTNGKSGRLQGLHIQVFELLKVVITLVLTGLIGGGITYYYQDRGQRDQQESKALETARNSALTFLREVGIFWNSGGAQPFAVSTPFGTTRRRIRSNRPGRTT